MLEEDELLEAEELLIAIPLNEGRTSSNAGELAVLEWIRRALQLMRLADVNYDILEREEEAHERAPQDIAQRYAVIQQTLNNEYNFLDEEDN